MADEIPPISVVIDADDSPFQEVIDRVKESLRDLGTMSGDPNIGADAEDFHAIVDDVEERLADVDGMIVEPSVGLNIEDFQARSQEIQTEAEALSGYHIWIDASINTTEFDEDDAELEAKIAELTAGPGIIVQSRIDESGYDADAAELEAKNASTSLVPYGGGGGGALVPFTGAAAGAEVAAGGAAAGAEEEAGGGTSALQSLNSIVDSLGAGFSKLGGVDVPLFATALAVIGPMGLVGIAAALTTLPALFTGAAAGAGVLGLALEPVLKTIEAMDAAKQSASTTDTTLAETQISNAESIQSAQDQVTATLQAQTQAENALQEAEYQELAAKQALTLAVQQAQFQLQDYTNQLADAALAQVGAVQSATQAKLNYDLVMSNPEATQLMRQQALLAYQEATQNITDQATSYQQLQKVSAEATQQQIYGTPAVQAAENAKKEAVLGVTQANQGVSNAATNASQAQTNLANATTEAALALKAANGPAQTAAQDFANLSQAGQNFVTFIEGPFDSAFKGLSGAAQTAILPGLQTFLTDIMADLPQWTPILMDAGQGISAMLTSLGAFYTTPTGKSQIATLGQEAGVLMGDMAQMSVNWIEAWTTMGAQAGPAVTAIGNGLLHISQEVLHWVSDGGFQHFMEWMQKNGPGIGESLATLAKAAGSAIVWIGEAGNVTAHIITGLDPVYHWFRLMGDQLGDFGKGLGHAIFDLAVWVDDAKIDLGVFGTWLGHWIADVVFWIQDGAHDIGAAWNWVFREMENGWDGFDRDVIQPIERFFTTDIEKWVGDATSALSGFMKDIPGGGVISDIAGWFGGGSSKSIKKGAAGGYIGEPTLLIAGEAGPEWLIPQSAVSGATALPPLPSVSPSASTGGAIQINVNVNAQGAQNPQAVATQTALAVRDTLLQTKGRQTGNILGVSAGGVR